MKIQRKNSEMDMLHGPLSGNIIRFALPLAGSSMLQQLFNAADTAIVGRFDGRQALAAVGSNTMVISLLVNMFVGLSIGANVVIAKYVGQRQEKQIKKSVHTVMSLAVLSGLFLLVLGQITAAKILTLMQTPEDVMTQAVLYLKIYCLGMPFYDDLQFWGGGTSMQRGHKTAFVFTEFIRNHECGPESALCRPFQNGCGRSWSSDGHCQRHKRQYGGFLSGTGKRNDAPFSKGHASG